MDNLLHIGGMIVTALLLQLLSTRCLWLCDGIK